MLTEFATNESRTQVKQFTMSAAAKEKFKLPEGFVYITEDEADQLINDFAKQTAEAGELFEAEQSKLLVELAAEREDAVADLVKSAGVKESTARLMVGASNQATKDESSRNEPVK